jgi:hypothetical protein
MKENLLDFHLEEQKIYSGTGFKYECVCIQALGTKCRLR